MKKTKIIFLLIVLVISLVGCSSTNPSLKEIWLVNQDTSNKFYESTISISFDAKELNSLPTSEEDVLILDMLEAGFVIDVKQKDEDSFYIKYRLNDPTILYQTNYFDEQTEPFFELYLEENILYARTSTEDEFLKLNNDSLLDSNFPLNTMSFTDEQREVQSQLLEYLKDYVEQFDFKMRKVRYVGKENVETPDGRIKAHHLHVELNYEDMRNFLYYTLGNLVEYEKFDEVATKIFELNPSMEVPQEEIPLMIKQLKYQIKMAQEQLNLLTKEDLEVTYGYSPDILITSDLYANNSAQTIKSDTTISVNISQLAAESEEAKEEINFDINVGIVSWNENPSEYELPNFDSALEFDKVIKDMDELNKLNEDSIIRQITIDDMKTRKVGQLQIGNDKAYVKGEEIKLDAIPYVVDGSTLVPIRVISQMANADVEWNEETREVTFYDEFDMIVVQIGNKIATVNGYEIEMPVAPEINNGRALVPLRFISESLYADVEYDAETKKIFIEFY